MTHKFKPGPAKLVNGMQAKIYEVMPDGHVFGAYYDKVCGQWVVHNWCPKGRYFLGTSNGFDLVPPDTERPSGWVNVYRRDDGSVFITGMVAETKGKADSWSGSYFLKRTHCIDLSDPALDKFRVDEGGETND